ncbi:MAG: DUF308 domain-containing protein [Bacteroidota bacterium]|nr:DUF308 domain-containing protein [Bacteroidota bacterium]
MNRYASLAIYGILIIITGIVVLTVAYNPTYSIQYIVGIGMLLSATFAFVTAYQSRHIRVPLNYHALHAVGMVVYGFAILFFANNIESFFNITTFFLLYYGITEVIFCLQILMLKDNVSLQTDIIRLILGVFVALGAVFIISTTYFDYSKALTVSGIVFIISGINLILFKTVVKKLDKSKIAPELSQGV